MTNKVVATDVALGEFERFLDVMELASDRDSMTDEDYKAFAKLKDTVIKAMESGHLVIDDEGRPVYTPRTEANPSPIVFNEMTGADLQNMDSGKATENVKKLYLMMGSATKNPSTRFSGMKNRDLKVCMAIFTLFMGG